MNRFYHSTPIDQRYQMVSFCGGLRGAIALALALSLSNDFPNRELMIAMTLGVVLSTILIGGTTTKKLIRIFKLDKPPILERLGEAQAGVFAEQAALRRMEDLKTGRLFAPSMVESLEQKYQQNLHTAEQSVDAICAELSQNRELMRQVL